MRKVLFFLLIVIYTSIYATVEIRSHAQLVAGTVTLHVYANTVSGQGVQAQARYGSPFTYTGFVAGTWSERGSGGSYTNYDVILSGLPTSGTVDFEASKLNVYGDVSQGGFEYTGFVYTIDDVLPVELTTFNASVLEKEVMLNWQTATETDNYGFEIQKQKIEENNTTWQKIGFVEGAGNSNSPKDYSYSDNAITRGKYQYRLKQIDIDGKFEYSDVIEVNFEIPTEFSISQNYPNPFNPTTTLQFSLPESGEVKIDVFNSIGEKVSDLLNQKMEIGFHSVKFNAENLNSGIYLYRIQFNDAVMFKKMILLK